MNPYPQGTLGHDFWKLEREVEAFVGKLKREIKLLAAAVWRRIENPNRYCLWGARKGYIQVGSFEDVAWGVMVAAAVNEIVERGGKNAKTFRELGAAIGHLSENMQRKGSA